MIGLTAKQSQVLEFICSYMAANRIAPSTDEIATGCGLASKSSVVRLLDALEERGVIRRIRGRTRAIKVLKRPGSDPADILRRIVAAVDLNGSCGDGPTIAEARAFLRGRPN